MSETLSVHIGSGRVVIIDADCGHLLKYKWYPLEKANVTYARGRMDGEYTALHHAVIGKPPEGLVVDHIDGDGLNNTRENLRFVTPSHNLYNSHKQARAGVSEVVNADGTVRYVARLGYLGNIYQLGRFRSRWAAQLLCTINRERVVSGQTIVTFVRKNRWTPIKRVEWRTSSE